jgi:signal transduction histidine kinase
VAREHEIEVDFQIDLAYDEGRSETRHSAEIESTIYRLVQEALSNVVKHSEATRVVIYVSDRQGDQLAVVVQDDGKGFDPSGRTGGFGLLGMRERLVLVRGTLRIESEPGVGTTLRASIPIHVLSGSLAVG